MTLLPSYITALWPSVSCYGKNPEQIYLIQVSYIRRTDRRMREFLLALSILLVLLSCGESQAQTPEALPDIFDPLSWEMNPKEVHQLFPKARVIESAHTIQERSGKFQKTKVITVSPLTWKHLGETYTSIYYDDKKIKLIRIETTESRSECEIFSQAKPPPKWCRHNYNKELLRTIDLVKKDISDSYGPPVKYNASTRHVPDPREIGYVWKRKGFDLRLVFSQDDQGVWAVTLTANET